MNFFLSLIFASFVSSSISLENVPHEVVYDGIMSRLHPLAAANLGMTCKTYLTMANESLLKRFGKNVNGSVVFDIELLDEIRMNSTDEHEKKSIQRLIESNYPVFKSKSLQTQHKYELAKRVLFTEEPIDFELVISGAFPEISRLILKHKKSHLEPLETVPFDGICPELADELASRVHSLYCMELEQIIIQRPPHLAAKFFACEAERTQLMDDILETGDLSYLVENTNAADSYLVALVICLANENNMDQVLKIVGNYAHPEFLDEYFMNWARYPHLKPVIRLLFERTPISQEIKEKLAVSFADLEGPMDYYESLYGSAIVNSAKAFLESYDESSRTFSGKLTVHLLRVFEVALFSGCSESLLESIMSLEGFQHDFPTVVIAIRLKKSTPFLLMLVQSEPTEDYDLFFKSRTTVDFFDLEVFRYLALHRITYQPGVFNLLYLLKDDQPALEYVRVLMYELDLDDQSLEELLIVKNYDRFADADLIRQELYQFALKKGAEFVWCRMYRNKHFAVETARQEFVAFFDGVDEQILLNYIPVEVNRSRVGKFFSGTLNSSYFFAFCSLANRPGGLDLLKFHFSDHTVFEELKFYCEFPYGNLSTLNQILKTSRYDLITVLLSAESSLAHMGKTGQIYERIKELRNEPELTNIIKKFVKECKRESVSLPFE